MVYQNTIEVDVNFHDGDYGNNLIEQNSITIPSTHLWGALQAGAPSLHKGPGLKNIIWKNNCYDNRWSARTDPTKFTSS
ncbi:hypothetical protein, partial [Pedobacter segetis]|uniref:hypothetical protein n=1 Tax=Pedobacter segetis TaxID=2793069 RepID=UPI001F309D1C